MPYRLPDWSVVCKCKVHVCQNVAVHVHMATLGFPSLSHAIGKVSLGCYLVTALLSIVVSTSDQLMRKFFLYVAGFNCGEASNLATPEWLRVAKEAAVRRASINRPPMVSHYQLLYELALSLCLRYSSHFAWFIVQIFFFLWDSFWPAASRLGKQKRKKNWFHCPIWL